MENASKALLMAGGVLIGILLLSLMVTLFASSSSLSKTYDETKAAEAIQQFNSNFIKYLGKDLTIHEVVTIAMFAMKNNVSVGGIMINEDTYKGLIKTDVESYSTNEDSIQKYKLTVVSYSNEGYIKSITFSEN